MTALTVGVDIGGTTTTAGLVDPAGRSYGVLREPTPHSPGELETLVSDLIATLARSAPTSPVAAGLAVAGFLTADRRTVLFAPHLPWRRARPARTIAARVGLPVVMDHDVNCAVWAESRLGAARGRGIALMLAVGTGIGAGLIVDGRVYRGAHGTAPEIGHLPVVPDGRPCPCGRRGCLERYCSGTALAQTARRGYRDHAPDASADTDPGSLTGKDVTRAARAGDPIARAAVRELAGWLGTAMTMVADLYDPDIIVIGGGVAAAADLFLAEAEAILGERITGGAYRMVPEVAVAQFGTDAALVGAALRAHQQVHAHEGA